VKKLRIQDLTPFLRRGRGNQLALHDRQRHIDAARVTLAVRSRTAASGRLQLGHTGMVPGAVDGLSAM